jgi:hypothetical protein
LPLQASSNLWFFIDLIVVSNESADSETEAQASSSATVPPPVTPIPAAHDTWISRLHASFVRHVLVVGALGAMIMIGLFLSNYSSVEALYYWCAMFPLFGVASISHQLTEARAAGTAFGPALLRQLLHWIGPVIAVKILFMQHARGQMSTDAVALTTVLVLAVTSFLAGVNFDSSFLWVSALLVLAALIGTEVETYLWLIVLLFAIGIVLATIGVVMLRRAKRTADAANPPAS